MPANGPGAGGERGRPIPAERTPGTVYEVDGLHLVDYLRVVYRRRWLAGTVFLLVFLSAFIYAVTATPIYDATVRLQIEIESPNVTPFRDVVPNARWGGGMRSEFYRTQYEILSSRSLARTTMDRLALWDHPEFAPDGGTAFNPVAWAIGSVRGAVSFPLRYLSAVLAPAPPAGGAAEAGTLAETRAETRAINGFLTRLNVTPVRDSRIVDVTFSSMSPALSADVANALAQAYIDQDLAFRHTSSRDASGWLRQRLDEQRRTVEAAELAMQRYREENRAVSLDEHQNVIAQELSDLNEAATRATTERIAKEARYREMRFVQDDPEALDRFPEIVGNTFIQEQKLRLADLRRDESGLADELGDLHPDLISIRSAIRDAEVGLRAEIARIVDSVRTDFEIAGSLEQQLQDALQRQTGEALALDRTGIEYGVLTREADSARRIYESLLARADETGITSELQTSAIRIVDAAETPLQPSRPRRGQTALAGLFGGLFAAIGLVFLVNYLDNRLKTPEEVREFLGLPCLGMLPAVARGRSGDGQLRLGGGAPENFASAVRTICTGVLFSSAVEGCRSVVVTSAEPGEGKSVLSSSLAVAIAQSGQRTLLVDADMMRSQVHVYWGQDAAPGLSDLLVGEAEASAAIRPSDMDGLWLLTAGTDSPNPTALLSSNRFRSLLPALRKRFDWIVFDTPPVLPISDATICANGADHVVFVADAGATSRHTAAAALERLVASGAGIAGVVLNRVDLEGHAYYYSRYYRRSYRHYYQSA